MPKQKGDHLHLKPILSVVCVTSPMCINDDVQLSDVQILHQQDMALVVQAATLVADA